MEARAQRLAVHRHVGATALRVGDGGFDLGLGIFGDIHGIEVNSRHAEGELDLTGAADQVFIRHMIFTNRPDDGSWFSHFCLSHRC